MRRGHRQAHAGGISQRKSRGEHQQVKQNAQHRNGRNYVLVVIGLLASAPLQALQQIGALKAHALHGSGFTRTVLFGGKQTQLLEVHVERAARQEAKTRRNQPKAPRHHPTTRKESNSTHLHLWQKTSPHARQW